MTPVDPITGAVEAFLAVYSNLPVSVRNLIGLALLLTVVVLVVGLIFRFRG